LDLRFDGVPLQLIPVQQIQALNGLARGNARLSGSPARPEGTANLQIETLRFHDQGLPSAGLTIQTALRDNLLQATVLLQGLSNSPLRAEVPALSGEKSTWNKLAGLSMLMNRNFPGW